MELFALGHGNGYTEDDVREGARALTGWVIGTDGQARMRPRRHDSGAKTLLGVTGDFDAAGFCDAVLAQPHRRPMWRAGCGSSWHPTIRRRRPRWTASSPRTGRAATCAR